MKRFLTALAVAGTIGAVFLGAATMAQADDCTSSNGPLGSSTTVGGDYPDWASDALAPKGRF